MATVYKKPGESFESLLKRFKREVEKSGILSEYRKHERYEKPGVRKKKKQAAARKKALKRQQKKDQRRKTGKNLNFRWNKDHTKKIELRPRTIDQNRPSQNRSNQNRPNQYNTGRDTRTYNRPDRQDNTRRNTNSSFKGKQK